jgi:putative membrane protein
MSERGGPQRERTQRVIAPPPRGHRRLDPRTLVTRVLTLSALRQYWGALLPLLAVLGVNRGFRSGGLVAVVAAAIVVVLAGALVEWLRTWYGVQDGRLVVERGLLRRSLTVVPVDRIRGVDVHASALQRLLGIVSVRVDAAATGGREDEAVLNAVSAAEGARLRDVLLREAAQAEHAQDATSPGVAAPGPTRPGVAAPGPAPGGPVADRSAAAAARAPVVLARFDPRWLLYAPLVGGYLLAPVAAIGALANYAGELRVPLPLRRWARDALGAEPGVRAILVAAVAVVLVSVAGAMVTAAVANWGFTLTRRGGTLVAERGLLSRRQVSLEHDRIRGYALAQPLGLRAVGAARLTALVTGLGGGEDNESGRRGQLLPLGPARVARAVAAAAVVRFDRPLRRHPPAARRRRLVRATLPWLVPAAVFGGFGIWPGLGACVGLAVLGIPLALDRYAGLGNAVDQRAVSVRSGSLRRRQVVLLRRGVVGATLRQTWFQRRAGLATVTLATGAGSGGYEAIDIGAADAVRLLRDVDPTRVSALSTLAP